MITESSCSTLNNRVDGIPEGWTVAPLGHCVDVLDHLRVPVNSDERAHREGTVPYYGATGQVGWIDDYLFDEELVLVGEDGAPFLDKSKQIAYIINGRSWVNNHAHVLRAIEGLTTNQYIKYQLDASDFSECVTGSTRLKLNQGSMNKMPVLLPPLAEQKRIVAKVEELLARVDAGRERLDRVPKIMKRFRQAVLAAACSGRLTEGWRERHLDVEPASDFVRRITRRRVADYEDLSSQASRMGHRKPRKPVNLELRVEDQTTESDVPESWFWMSLEGVASARQYAMSSGPFGSALGTKDYTSSGVPVIRGQNVQSGYFVLNNLVHVTEEKAAELARSTASPGDIVVVAVGSSGQAAVVPQDLPVSVLSQNCNKITVDTSVALPEYVVLFLQIETSKDQLREKTTDTARPFLSLTNLKSTIIAVPPLEEQREIVRRVEALFKLADAIEKRVAAARLRADKLTQSILAKAFRGELVPTEAELARREGRTYEPAAVLLERIRAEREKGKPQTKKKRLRG